MELILDVNTQLYPMEMNDKFRLQVNHCPSNYVIMLVFPR